MSATTTSSKIPRVSILVPVCNVQRYLRECLNSIAEQSLADIQVICIDDGSTDLSLSILREYEAKDSRFEIITKPNSGYGDSMNIGLSKACGEYVGIVESDDFAALNMFESLYALAKRFDADVVKSNYRTHSAGSLPSQDPLLDNLGNCTFDAALDPLEDQGVFLASPAIWSCLYRRSFLDENDIRFLPTPGASFQDTSFNFKALALAKTVALSHEGYLHYRIDNASSSVKSMKKTYCVCEEYAEMWRFLEDYPRAYTALSRRLPQMQYGAYQWNLERLTPSLQYGFYTTFVEEFKQLNEKGLLDEEVFAPNVWSNLTTMLEAPDEYFKTNYGPIEVGSTTFMRFDGKPSPRRLEDAVEGMLSSLSETAEVIVVDCHPDSEFEQAIAAMRAKDKRVFSSVDSFACAALETIDLDALRGSEVRVVCVPCDKDGETVEIRHTKQELQAINAPVSLPLLPCGFYETLADSAPLPRLFEGLGGCSPEGEPRLADYKKALEAFGEIEAFYHRAFAEKPHATRKLAFRALCGVWSALKKEYWGLGYRERLIAGARPSSASHPESVLASTSEPTDEAPLVSVIIPVFNAAPYILRCLDTVLSQRLAEGIEVICINDASTDNSLDVLENVASRDPRLRIYTQLNGGAGAARNLALTKARGSWIAFIDSDDYYPDAFAIDKLVRGAVAHGVRMCGGSFGTIDAEGNLVDEFSGELSYYTFQDVARHEPTDYGSDYGWIRFIYDAALFKEEGLKFPELLWYEDPVFLLKAFGAAGSYATIPDVVYRYRGGHKEIAWSPERVADLLAGVSANLSLAKEHGDKALYSLLIDRLEGQYYAPIRANLHDSAVLDALAAIQGGLDCTMLNSYAEGSEYRHILRPLADELAERRDAKDPVATPQAMLPTQEEERLVAIVRAAQRIGRSAPYRAAQRIVWKLRGLFGRA